MSEIHMTFIGLERWQRDLARATPELRKLLHSNLMVAGRFVQRAIKAEFGPRLTDPRTRQRDDPGSRLGTFTGRAKASIKVSRVRIRSQRDFRVSIGPTQKPGFYVSLHARGTGRFRKRDPITPAVRKTKRKIWRRLGLSLKAIK